MEPRGRDELHARDAPQDARLRGLPQGRRSSRARRATATAATGPDYERSRNPNHAAAGFPTDCSAATSRPTPTWQRRDVQPHATFPLVGVHATQACAACHKNNVYKGTPRDCVGCHRTDYDAHDDPEPRGGRLPDDVRHLPQVHRPGLAPGASFNHTRTFFPLVGVARDPGLRGVPQEQRLQGHAARLRRLPPGRLRATPRTRTTPRPASRRPARRCHKSPTRPGSGADVQPHATTFPLVGVHATQAVRGLPHEQRLQGHAARLLRLPPDRLQTARRTPNHVAAGFPTTCETCHKFTDPAWKPGDASTTRTFPLVGVHATQACAACHKNNVYKGTPATASAATRPTTTARRTRTTSRPASRRPARPATSSPTRPGSRRDVQPHADLPAGRRPRDAGRARPAT